MAATGKPEVTWHAEAWMAALLVKLARNMDAVGAYVAQEAKARAPRAAGAGHAGGGAHAADSITYKVSPDRRAITVRVGATNAGWYLGFHEIGTSKMAAHPWLRPVIFGNADKILELLTRGG